MNIATVEQKQNTQSSLVQLNSKGDIKWISLNPNPIQFSATQLWESLTEKDTAVTYKQAIIKTWKLLKYLLALLFFVFLLAVALIISFWGIGFNLGGQLHKWLDNAGEYDLNLMSLDSADDLPNEGKNLVIAAKIGDSYHVLIFDRTGNKVIDKGEGEFLANPTLTWQLDGALELDSSTIDKQIKDKLILEIIKSSGIGYTGRQPAEFFSYFLLLPIQKIVKWANKHLEKYLPGWKPLNCKFFETEEK